MTDFGLSGTSEDNPGVVVEKFWARKVIVGVTKQGKMYVLTSHQDWRHPMAENVPQCW